VKTTPDPFFVRPFRRALLRWYERHHRDLPWRRTRDPYAVWVAETMLQQTRSETVAAHYTRFLRRFPTVRALARARETDVLALWSGLGYYSRARNLRLAARVLVARHRGRLPADAAALDRLPGVGRYTAAAVASIAFDVPAPLVDGNVARVLARVFAVEGPTRSAPIAERLWALAERLVPRARPGDWNQALMELGATLCAPREPDCARCPIRPRCAAWRSSRVGELPTPARRTPSVRVRRAVAVVERRGRYLVVRDDGPRLLRGLWQFPGVDLMDGRPAAPALRRRLGALGLASGELRRVATIRHAILDRRIDCEVFAAPLLGPTRRSDTAAILRRWVTTRDLGRVPLSAVGLRILRRLAISAGDTRHRACRRETRDRASR
jgi:A/G-specific adenine glycosylase